MTDLTVATTEDMTAEEGKRLVELERRVAKAMDSAGRVVGVHLAEIRDDRLYRASHGSFERYCVDRLGISRSTADRMIAVSRGETNGLPPEVAAIGQASARAAQRRHTTLDQPPSVLPQPSEPLERRPDPPEEDEEEPEEPKLPEGRLIPPSPLRTDSQIKHGRLGAVERRERFTARDQMNRLMQVLDAADDEALAKCATTVERRRIARLAIAMAAQRTRDDDSFATPAHCDHPISRGLGSGKRDCGKCGQPKVRK